MGYYGKINRKLRTVELNDDECLYKLAYEEEKRRYFEREDILNNVNEYYLKKDNIIEENLLNDLNTFKTYRDDVEQIYNNQDLFNKILSLLLTCVTTIFGAIGNKGNYEYKLLFGLMIAIVYINMIYNVFRTTSKSESYKLKFISNAIYTLETIKEDKYRNGNWGTKSDERYEGLELTEVKEIRTYTYKATKNKYSPRAMHHRKRR